MRIKTRITLSTMLLIILSLAIFMGIFTIMMEIYSPDVTKALRGLQNGKETEQVITLTKESLLRFQSHLRWVSGISFICVLGGASLVAYYTMKRFLYHPINLLTKAAKRIHNNDLSVPIVYTRNDEFKDVCHIFNQMQIHLSEERKKTASYEKARIDMIAGISHDLRTPLTSVKGYIKGITDGIAATPAKQQQYLQIAYKKANEMDALLTKLFNISKLETGNLLIEKERFELTEVVKQYIQELRLTLIDNPPEITIRSETKLYINGDVEQICQILSNLVTNSIKYAQIKPLKIVISLTKRAQTVQITFSDNGPGVKEEHLDHLFKQFWRSDHSRSPNNPGGSGLGLYIIKRIVDGHNGTVCAFNDQGLTVEINLPECEANNEHGKNINSRR